MSRKPKPMAKRKNAPLESASISRHSPSSSLGASGTAHPTPPPLSPNKQLVSFDQNPMPLPAILYIPGKQKNEDDPYDLATLAPSVSQALQTISPYNSGTSRSGPGSKNRRPHYWLVRSVDKGLASAWFISSGGTSTVEKQTFLEALRTDKNRMIPLDEVSREASNWPSLLPAPSVLQFLNPTTISTQKNPLQGFLITTAEALFPTADLTYYLPHSFSIPKYKVVYMDAYILSLEQTSMGAGGAGERGAGGSGLGSAGGAGAGNAGGSGAGSGGGGGGGAGRAGNAGAEDGGDSGVGDAGAGGAGGGGEESAGGSVGDADSDSGDALEEAIFIASLGGPWAPAFCRVVELLLRRREENAKEELLHSQQQVMEYLEAQAQLKEPWEDIRGAMYLPESDAEEDLPSDDDRSIETPNADEDGEGVLRKTAALIHV
ncbi:hypothetical protein FB451DRAFT_1362401 [Mycena latifolia]|nr:hypothetical protein FB451DRAFT_1362401 [Mycena latifolia]